MQSKAKEFKFSCSLSMGNTGYDAIYFKLTFVVCVSVMLTVTRCYAMTGVHKRVDLGEEICQSR